MPYIYFDIETIPAAWTQDEWISAVRAAVPGNYSKADSIERWMADNAADVWRRTALDPWAGRILCIGVAVDEEPPEVYWLHPDAGSGLDELQDHIARRVERRDPVWVGHHCKGFDLPRLRHLAIRERHPMGGLIPGDKWGKAVDDTEEMWLGTDYRGHAKLSAIAEFLGLAGKVDGMDGSRVADLWVAGRLGEIATYCAGDVRLTRNVHRRIRGLPELAIGDEEPCEGATEPRKRAGRAA